MAEKILIVDDEQDICEIVSFNLTRAGYDCEVAHNGREGLRKLHDDHYSLVLLDVMMPEMSGFDVAKVIRNDEIAGVPYDLPIIFLTALGEEDDMLRGFHLGADDYICKPFSLQLLIARVEAVLKRTNTPAKLDTTPTVETVHHDISFGDLMLDSKHYVATLAGEDLGLTKMEYELLYFLVLHQGTVYSRSNMIFEIWPSNGLVLERTVDVTINRLRKKLGDYKDHIKTKNGYGYYWKK